ncbi:GNAT family N-acetyltransferase [Novosphingobium aquimarinum]|uniref:GNAT family N-acetyltransferase n=1 Tax=Novosphingobium aquimarinum TaxID=2682494 RepID=UPI0012EC2AD8|nr:GNAT family N-acetyltransferase [Novosphingobium aquimarinum]
MKLRAAGPDDAPALAHLGREAFCAAFAHLYAASDLDAFLAQVYDPPRVAGELADPAIRVQLAEDDDGALAGYCKLRLACGWPEEARGSRVIELKQLYTAPDRTSGGIGAALMAWAEAEARHCGADEIQLSVWSGNHRAQRFYARHGFAKVADTEFWVGTQRDEEFLFARML